jgi:hypothetical protein
MRRQLMWAAYRPDSGESRDWPRFAGDLEGRLLPRVVLDATSRVDRFSGHGAVPARLLLSTKHSGPVEVAFSWHASALPCRARATQSIGSPSKASRFPGSR